MWTVFLYYFHLRSAAQALKLNEEETFLSDGRRVTGLSWRRPWGDLGRRTIAGRQGPGG